MQSWMFLLVLFISFWCFIFYGEARLHHHHHYSSHHRPLSKVPQLPQPKPAEPLPSFTTHAPLPEPGKLVYSITQTPSPAPEIYGEDPYISQHSPLPEPAGPTSEVSETPPPELVGQHYIIPQSPSSPPEPARLLPTISQALTPAPEPAAAPTAIVDSSSSSRVYDIRTFGAVGDGVTDDTEALKMAWDTACQCETAAVLLIPYRHSFMIQPTMLTGPCQSGLMLQVDGTLMPPDGPESWPGNASRHQWLVFYRIAEFALQGGGLIDGRGQKWWELPCKPHKGMNRAALPGTCDSPIAIRFFLSSNLTVQGLKIKNSPQFHLRFDNCSHVHIKSIYITSPALSPNTDGIHIENTNNVKIHNSLISNGDDCVSIGSGCHDVEIKNITCGPSHGISIGSLGNRHSRACVSNITVSDSVIKNSDNGVRIKTWQGGSGSVSSVTFSHIHMENVRNPIIVDQFYCLSKDCKNQTSAVLVSGISYTNIKGTYDVRSPPMHFACSDSVPCANLTLSDVELFPAQGDVVLDPFCWNAYGGLQNSTVPPVSCLLEGIPQSLMENISDVC